MRFLFPYLLCLSFFSCGGDSDNLASSGETLGGIPEGMVLAINDSSCPSGWSELSSARGRMLIGVGSTTDGHGVISTSYSLLANGGFEQTKGIPYSSASATSSTPSATGLFGSASGGNDFYDESVQDLDMDIGDPTDSNLPPFMVITYCEKDSTEATSIAANTITASSVSCSGDWSSYSTMNGRIPLGQGSGNSDGDSNSLTARSLGATGGRENTRGLPGSSGSGDDTNPGSATLATSSLAAYSSNSPDTCIGGTSSGSCTDGNMPPFLVVQYCSLATESTLDFPAGTVSHFNLSACPDGWSEYTDASGRFLLGAGSGNMDVDSNSLTSRTLGDTGGFLRTTAVPAYNGANGTSNPASAYFAGATFNYIAATIAIGGYIGSGNDLANANLPPYLALLTCIKN